MALISVTSLCIKTFLFSRRGELAIVYPFDGSVFPPEIAPATVWWEDAGSDANKWHVAVEFASGHDPIEVDVDTTLWAPSDALWETIKAETLDTEARITVSGLVTFAGIRRTLSSQTIAISTSPDSVGAPIFFREVPLPVLFANVNLRMVKWRLGDIGSHERPPVVLEDLPSCGNCHSFSADEFRSASRIDPTRGDALVYLGNVNLRMGDIEGAIREFERALQLDPSAEALRERIDELKRRASRRAAG